MRLLRILLGVGHVGVGAACSALAFPYVAIFLSADSFSNPTQVRFGREFVPLLLIYFLPSLVCGVSLLFSARWVSLPLLLLGVAYLFLPPLGTALGLVTIAVIVLSLRERAWVPSLPPGDLIRFGVTMVMTGSGLAAGLLALFRYHGDVPPWGLDNYLLPSLGLFLAALLVFILYVVPRWPRGGTGLRNALAPSGHSPHLRERIARLASDPATAAYASRIEAGEMWTDEQIAYDRDPTRLASCAHLHDVERDLRRSGIIVRFGHGNYIDCECHFDPDGLARRYALSSPVEYLVYPPERDGADETPALRCKEHGFAILARPDKRFPAFP